jgi:hypothetical protein
MAECGEGVRRCGAAVVVVVKEGAGGFLLDVVDRVGIL